MWRNLPPLDCADFKFMRLFKVNRLLVGWNEIDSRLCYCSFLCGPPSTQTQIQDLDLNLLM